MSAKGRINQRAVGMKRALAPSLNAKQWSLHEAVADSR